MARRRKRPEIPALNKLQSQFERWRKSRSGREPIPDPLWDAARDLARSHGVFEVARVLRLNYASLKARVDGRGAAPRKTRAAKKSRPAFVQLGSVAPAAVQECVIELEDRGKAKMSIRLTGKGEVDLAALATVFFKRRR